MQYDGVDNLQIMEKSKIYNHYLLQLLENTLQTTDKIVLDFGAGTGFYAKQFQRNNPKREIIALEPAENLNDFYEQQNIKKISSLNEVPQVDLIYSFNVLEHIEDDQTVLKQLYGKLKDGGHLNLYVPAFPCLYSCMDKTVGHYRRYTKKELMQKVQTAGFRVKKCQYKDFAGFFASFLYKILGNSCGDLNPVALKIYDQYLMPISILADKLTYGKIVGKNLWLETVK